MMKRRVERREAGRGSRRFPSIAPCLVMIALTAGGLLATAGCGFKSHGPWWSGNARLTYDSTSIAPKTVSLIDTRTDETIWSVDVPINWKLVVRFNENENPNDLMSDVMEWGVMPISQRRGSLDNSMPVPGRVSRRIDMAIRSTPGLTGSAPTTSSLR